MSTNKYFKRNKNLRDVYAEKGVKSIPRMLGLMDRNKYSKTYGCMDRNYWLDKSIDFPSSIMQFGAHALALVYAVEMPHNVYYKNKKILGYVKAAMEYWIKIQKNDGSYDEFYPNERGWAGPTGFLLYAMADSYKLLEKELSKDKDFTKRLFETFEKASLYLAKYDEYGVLANHHAMALLPIYYAYTVTGKKKLLYNFKTKWKEFIGYQSDEGWFLEYDGADIGYLSASISFMGKIYQITNEKWLKDDILKAVGKATEFSSYFVYPNGYYGGTMGSRQTLHFYPHGYEIFSQKIPMAGLVAEKMLIGLGEGKLVPPEIMADRYFVYRVPEMLLSYKDYSQNAIVGTLPYEDKPFFNYFEKGKIAAINNEKYYGLVNAAKGGVVKVFDKKTKKLIANDCGIIGKNSDGKTIASQWINDGTKVTVENGEIVISGNLFQVGTMAPTPFKFIVLRGILLTLGRSTSLAYKIKGVIRNMIILKNKKTDNSFVRRISFNKNSLKINNTIYSAQEIKQISIGDEFSVRYVPQSLYFQNQELDIKGKELSEKEIEELNSKKIISVESVNLKW